MELLDINELKSLANCQEKPCISIYMPSHRAGREIEQDPIRLKNLLRETDRKLDNYGLRRKQIDELLSPAEALLGSYDFWNHQSDGLAIFLSKDESHIYRLPIAFDEAAIVSHRYHLKRLMPLFVNDGRFFVLTLSQKQSRLFEATKHSINEYELQDIPVSFEEFMQYEDPEKQLQYHTGTGETGGGGKQGRRRAMYHGHGSSIDEAEKKEYISRFFKTLENGVDKAIAGRLEPLILVGLEHYIPMYREASSYRRLLDNGVRKNPDDLKEKEIHELAWKEVEPYFGRERQNHIKQYRELLGTGEASNNLEQIIKAAYGNRVECLFLKKRQQIPGSYHPKEDKITVYEKEEPGSEDLLDFAAIKTILSNGVVYIMEEENMPDENPAAAVYRY
jgi:hypothetical protein